MFEIDNHRVIGAGFVRHVHSGRNVEFVKTGKVIAFSGTCEGDAWGKEGEAESCQNGLSHGVVS